MYSFPYHETIQILYTISTIEATHKPNPLSNRRSMEKSFNAIQYHDLLNKLQ